MKIDTESVIKCPDCGFEKKEAMPLYACVFFYKCESCSSMLKPKEGDCCVFCSFGSVKCPPVQNKKECC